MRAGSQRLCGIILLSILFAATSYADPFTFSTTPPDGNISGAAGSTVGWGYTVTNNTSDQWLLFYSIDTDAPFPNGTALSLFDFPLVAPGASVATGYDGINGFGLYQFTWLAGTLAGSVNSGNFVLRAELWSGNPFEDGAPDGPLESIAEFTVPYSVAVPVSCNCTSVPETSSLQLMAFAIVGLVLFNRNRLKLRDAA